MSIGWATLVPGTEMPVGSGLSGATRCILAIEGQANIAAILKRDPLPLVIAEAFCALLLRGWGVPVPDPYLVADMNGFAFASADATYPNLNQRLGIDQLPADSPSYQAALAVAVRLATQLGTAPLVAAADEAIDNRDRNLGNILWDGTTEAWIDHALSLGNGNAHNDANKLCQMALMAGTGDEMRGAATSRWFLMDRDMPRVVTEDLAPYFDTSLQLQFVTDRLNQLGMRLLARFPAPSDLLSGK